MNKTLLKTIEDGVKVSGSRMFREDKIWSQYSNDKVDVGETLAKVLRTLQKALPLREPLRALSIGSSNEPQFRNLQAACAGGLYLLDIEREALNVIHERVRRQKTGNVSLIQGDYKKIFLSEQRTMRFLTEKLGGKKVDLITLHHSLYYCEASLWQDLLRNLYTKILAPRGAIHCTLMASRSDNPYTTTWLYNHFAGKYFGHVNDQSLPVLKRELQANRLFHSAQLLCRTSKVRFFVDDFQKFMAVIWMILLYPNVHRYSREQRRAIAAAVAEKFFRKRRPLLQEQDHLIIYRGIGFRGLT